ncbi:hypothetical protein Goklo_000494 [Gossypium klotzschianum]|uniref:Uncharacterized protein n=1 Tax=Gossypium klotzschianum TaxID=34286 RepID=A0A7J8VY87_9ROSI|nr:hypothetical protein [Gossypium klotzschianum]
MSRNKFIHEGECRPGPQVAKFVLNYLKELDGVNENLPGRVINPGGWTAQKGSSVEINFDAASNRQRKESCSGLVVRNDKEEIICSKTTMHAHILYVFLAKAMVCLQAILLGLDLGLESNKFAHVLVIEGIKGRENTYLVSAFAPFTAEEANKDWRWVELAS